MAEKAAHEPSIGDESFSERECAAMLANESQRGPFLGFYSLPESLRRIMADYVSNDKRDPKKLALLGKPFLILCLSQHADLELGSCWNVGCRSPRNRLETFMKVRLYKKYLIKEHQSCLDFLDRENSFFCPSTIDILVFQLDVSSPDLSSVLNDLQNALTKLQNHLCNVQHVVFAIEKHACCCFSFNGVIDNATGRRRTVDRLLALTQILDDLRTCLTLNHMLSTKLLLDYYISKEVKPKSDKYLSKFVISLKHGHNQALLDAVALTLKSSKLMWLYYLETIDEARMFDRNIARRCHALHADISKIDGWDLYINELPSFNCLGYNHFVERIVINSHRNHLDMKLPRPRASLTNTTPLSALIELSLTGDRNTFDLSQLNNRYFPHLARLCVVGGEMTGFLDSQSVPSLKTLRIQLGHKSFSLNEERPLIQEHTQAIVAAHRPWQLVASQDQKGWSLASYDGHITNPQDEVKEDAPQPLPSLPVIRELMLMMATQKNANEWRWQLNGNPSLKRDFDDRADLRLVWAPECVEKITAFRLPGELLGLVFQEEIPGHTRILTSLACHSVDLVANGAALPHLETLEMNDVNLRLWGTFPQLQTLSSQKDVMKSPCQLDAPSLRSLSCVRLQSGKKLSLRPELLPLLSYLRIELLEADPVNCPTILVDGDRSGFSRVKHVMFGCRMTRSPFFDEFQVQNVSHLELAVDVRELPACWKKEWQCETLTINVYGFTREKGITHLKMPRRLPRVKTLTVTSGRCPVLLDSEMPNLIDLTVPSPRSLGPNLKCPKLRCIRFTDDLSESNKVECFDRATYVAIGAQPKLVYINDDSQVKRMSWAMATSAIGVSSFAEPLEDGGNSFVLRD